MLDMFSLIFVADTKIIFRYDWVAIVKDHDDNITRNQNVISQNVMNQTILKESYRGL